jgi:PAS domain S-box-containing protein
LSLVGNDRRDADGARWPDLSADIAAAGARLDCLRRDAGVQDGAEGAEQAAELALHEALTEAYQTLEELRVSQEDLRLKSDELVRTRRSVDQERQRYYELFNLAPDGHIITDAAGIIREANRAASILLNLHHQFISGKALATYVAPEDRAAFRSAINALRVNKVRSEWEARLTPRNADPFTAQFVVTPVTDPITRKEYLHWVVRDVTEIKRTGERLLELNADLERQVQSRTRALEDAYERERAIAEDLQRSLMPIVAEDAFPHIGVAMRYEAAVSGTLVGGDFYDAFSLGDGHVALVVGDVSGKGLPAAAYTSQIRSVLYAFLREGRSPEQAIAALNDFVCGAQRRGDWRTDLLVALCLVVIQLETGEVTYLCAGSEQPVLVKPDGALEIVGAAGIVIGASPGTDYDPVFGRLDPGDTILLVTDGITEARHGNEFLGADGLLDIVRGIPATASLDPSADAVLAGAHAFAGGPLRDDACVLLVRRL